MAQIQRIEDPTGSKDLSELDSENINMIINEMNRGPDITSVPRRTILAGQIKVLSYQPNPIQLLTFGGSGTIGSGVTAYRVINFTNNGLTNAAGQTFIPTVLVDLFVDPSATNTTAAIYASGSAVPDGANVTSGMANLSFSCYLRNSTPGTNQDVVSYVVTAHNFDGSSHAYWVSIQILLPADGNLNPGGTAVYLP